MANTYKNIVITPSIGNNTVDPKIVFSGANTNTNTDITVFVYPTANGTLSFEGSAGQLFSITNDLSNNIFRAADVSGVPLIDAFANGLVALVPTSGNVGIANTTPAHKLSVNGTGYFVGNVGIGTTTAGEPLAVSRNTNYNNSSVLAGTVARFIGPDGTQSRVILDAYGAGTNMSFRHASGTAATPTATSSGSSIIGINGFGYGTSGYTTSSRASFNAVAAETWTDAAQGTYLSFQTTATGSLVTSEKVRIDSNGRVYIGAVPASGIQLYLGGNYPSTTDAYGFLTDQTVPSTATSSATAVLSNPSTAAATFTLPSLNHFVATQGTIGAGSTVTNQRGFYAFNTLTGATNNYGFFSDIASGTNRWNFYGNGTAYSFFQGAVGFGNGPLAYTQKRIGGTAPSSSTLSYSTYSDQTAPAATTGEFASYYSIPNTTAATFTLGSLFHYIAVQGTFGAGSTVTNQFGVYIGNNLTGATNNYGLYSNIPSGANRYNIYVNGTAQNLFRGDTLIFGTGGLGYTTGSGGAVTQGTSRTTGVTLNNTNGAITLFTTTAVVGTWFSFTVTNSTVAATDTVVVSVKSGTNIYVALVSAVAAGSFRISMQSISGTVSDAPVVNFAVIKAVTA